MSATSTPLTLPMTNGVSMSLTGAALMWLLCILAVGSFVWSILAWPRSAGSGAWAILRRVGHQLSVLVLVIAALGVMLNREYDWYSNWSDLAASFSSATPSGDIQVAGAAPSDAGAGLLDGSPNAPPAGGATARGGAVLDSAASLGLESDPGPGGQYEVFSVPGPISGHTGDVSIWFPPDYGTAAQAHHRFPVIEAFHGVPGSPRQLSGTFVNIGHEVAAQVAAHHLRDAIVVMPSYTPGGLDTECVNGTGSRPRMEDWITKDIPAWVEAHVRVDRDRGSWATFGFSAGGWCAAMSAMLHPETYAAAIVLQGYFQPTFEAPYIPFVSSSPDGQHYDLLRLAHVAPPRVALWILTSKADPVSYRTTAALLANAQPPLSITADVLTNGGHRTSVWTPLVPTTLQWLGTNLPGFAPVT